MYEFKCTSCGGNVKTDSSFLFINRRTCEECHELEGIKIDLDCGDITYQDARLLASDLIFKIVENGGLTDISFLDVAE